MSSYVINKTDGSILAIVPDGTVNSTSSSLQLVGRNVINYGEIFAENLVKMTEHFANSSPPMSPMIGQIWFDSLAQDLKVFKGSSWDSVTPDNFYSRNSASAGNGQIEIRNDRPLVIGASARLGFSISSSQSSITYGSLSSNSLQPALSINHIDGTVSVASMGSQPESVTTKDYVDNKSNLGSTQNNFTISSDQGRLTLANTVCVTFSSNETIFSTPVKVPEPSRALIDNTVATVSLVRDFFTNSNLLGEPRAAVPPSFDNSDRIATTSFVSDSLTRVDLTPYARLQDPEFFGNVRVPDVAVTDNSTRAVNSAFVQNLINQRVLSSPSFSGIPTAPTAAPQTSTDQVATTSFVQSATRLWDGSRKFVSTQMPDPNLGSDGDIWFRVT